MSKPIIEVCNLSKKYRLGEFSARSLRDEAELAWKRFRRWNGHLEKGIGDTCGPEESSKDFWALKDVSFSVQPGEVVGVVGCNGAGKSTLLKILSRITEPTDGEVIMRGRVASLLEVGTGFHPELSGRENIYLNGAILGMKKAEVHRKFDEIVDFAEVQQFIDTPVKRYSSGMYVRLAFAVAAHLEPEILIVDEVLAVGDAAFQKKCLGKMQDVSRKEGRTVLFVSHNMAAVSNLCRRCILLSAGRISADGVVNDVVSAYSEANIPDDKSRTTGEFDLTRRENPYTPGTLIIRKTWLRGSSGAVRSSFSMGEPFQLIVEVDGFSDYKDALIGVQFRSIRGENLGAINTAMVHPQVENGRERRELIALLIEELPFTPGRYSIAVSVVRGPTGSQYRIDYVESAATFHIIDSDVYGTGYRVTSDYGVLFLRGTWSIGSLAQPMVLKHT